MAKHEGLVDLKRSKGDSEEKSVTLASPSSHEKYPYGTELHLDHETMDKLGMKTPRVGDVHHVHAHAHVTSISENHRDGGKKERRVTLQLRKMSVQPHKAATGHAGGKHADAAAGAKAMMDAALKEPADATDD